MTLINLDLLFISIKTVQRALGKETYSTSPRKAIEIMMWKNRFLKRKTIFFYCFFFISKYVHGEIKTYISYVRLGSTFSNDPIKSNKVHRLNRHRQLSACLGFMLPAFMFDVLCQRLSESVSQMEFYLLCLRNIKYLDINPRLFW